MDTQKEEYDIIEAFKAIENRLLDGLMRNIINVGHKDYANWRLEELKRLEEYRINNLQSFPDEFSELNKRIEDLIWKQYEYGMNSEERRILNALKAGYIYGSHTDTAYIASLNKAKIEALIKATKDDFEKAEVAILKKVDDEYRKIIFNAEVGLNTGSLSYTEAVDMATKDFLAAGIQCIQYKNGSMHSISDYADMAVKTANKKAYLSGEGEKRQEYGLHLVLVGQRGGSPCKCCVPYVGKILIDDVYSGGSRKDGDYTLLSEAMANGLYHPRCKDIHTTYFPGITKKPKPLTKDEIDGIDKKDKEKRRENYEARQAEKYKRISKYSINSENKREAKARYEEWK